MDNVKISSIEFSEKVLEKYLALFNSYIVKKRYDELNTTYTLTGKFDIALGELKSIFRQAEREGIFITLQRNGQILKNNISKCYFFSLLFSLMPLLIAVMLTAGSYMLYNKRIVPEEVFLSFTLATFFQFVFVTLTDILKRLERHKMINNKKNV